MDEKEIAIAVLQATQSSATWAFWSMIGTWVSGIATFLAVIVSLYLANRRSRPVLNVTVEWCHTSGGQELISGIGITVANAAESNVVVTSIAWEMGCDKKLAQMFDHPYSAKMPLKLAGGESALFFVENDKSNRWLRSLLSNIKKNEGKINKLTACVCLASGIKKRCKAKVVSTALEKLMSKP